MTNFEINSPRKLINSCLFLLFDKIFSSLGCCFLHLHDRSCAHQLLGIDVLFQLRIAGGRRGATVGRHFDMGRPQDRVEHDFTTVVVLPDFMIVRAGKPESASATGPLRGPSRRPRVSRGGKSDRIGVTPFISSTNRMW